jgi:hypothetical protein
MERPLNDSDSTFPSLEDQNSESPVEKLFDFQDALKVPTVAVSSLLTTSAQSLAAAKCSNMHLLLGEHFFSTLYPLLSNCRLGESPGIKQLRTSFKSPSVFFCSMYS